MDLTPLKKEENACLKIVLATFVEFGIGNKHQEIVNKLFGQWFANIAVNRGGDEDLGLRGLREVGGELVSRLQ